MTSDKSICNLRLSKFAEGLIPEKKLYCEKLKELTLLQFPYQCTKVEKK
jgi:hypothetical protein